MKKKEVLKEETEKGLETRNPEPETLSGTVSPEQIAMWKNLYRDVFEVIARDKICYLKRPDRKTFQAVDAVAESDPIRVNEILLENCWLGGDPEIKTNDLYFMEASGCLGEILDFGRAKIKKL